MVCLSICGAAQAQPITLICNGNLNADGKQVNISGESAIVDLEKLTFKPPLYSEFPITRVAENDLSFGSELPSLSTWGSLDRVSGTLTMNVLRPDERKKLQAGGSAHFLTWMSAKCAPAKRMF
ncbi:hypothetical protein [Bradyrhizobium sp. MOS003]|uniref:hypothetical protein n=1 Tax=Bradyrhizobium sp. MOS003 TaxID=2133946 RepID=UPI000D136CBC|nr:hypothetical protein [Bradyrhizobium sp. MOS003]PSO19135.1 hypothetical protein C7G42_12600 [Bradyrhizobium sp. MOS003]